MMKRLRVLSYNVHRCVGGDGVYSPHRIADVIRSFTPDVVALQELDVGHPRSGHADQPAEIAALLGMRHLFFPAIERANEHYGDAILTPHVLEPIRVGPLPTLPDRPRLERRGALWAAVRWQEVTVQVLNTHLGLNRRERLSQIESLLGPDWLGDPRCQSPRIFCGDFNAWPGTRAYALLRGSLQDPLAGRAALTRRATFPARWPLVQLDHVFLSNDFVVHRVEVPRTPLTRVASDHLPVVVEVSLA
jgi:endonuclease/exonuclease/phosphatase family metal-dependent hydrolase